MWSVTFGRWSGMPEPEVADVLEVPGGRLLGQRGARARRGVVDLVVHVGDVVDEVRLVARSRAARSASHMPITNGRALPMWARA